MPVLEDGYSGVMSGIENFADSQLHLSDQGTATRSEALAIALKAHLMPEARSDLPTSR
ncbi:MAG: hypothetical protein NWT08_10105 [Akkermansiaceae bacterium]|jgi:hypothetical protein|nr:hypothetical protein [Akkermansiaceae bacterium]MDP4721672.1 hypothetical protein [Akkermansiaceae bacterium]MDP4778844.1 hypothetical protein [Akkermansiaceae bacterium]MDP4846955.1 hypothetical protein [Akkermansiaceae bacterium]